MHSPLDFGEETIILCVSFWHGIRIFVKEDMILDHLHVLFSFTSPLIDSFFRFPLFGAFRKPPPKKTSIGWKLAKKSTFKVEHFLIIFFEKWQPLFHSAMLVYCLCLAFCKTCPTMQVAMRLSHDPSNHFSLSLKAGTVNAHNTWFCICIFISASVFVVLYLVRSRKKRERLWQLGSDYDGP